MNKDTLHCPLHFPQYIRVTSSVLGFRLQDTAFPLQSALRPGLWWTDAVMVGHMRGWRETRAPAWPLLKVLPRVTQPLPLPGGPAKPAPITESELKHCYRKGNCGWIQNYCFIPILNLRDY